MPGALKIGGVGAVENEAKISVSVDSSYWFIMIKFFVLIRT